MKASFIIVSGLPASGKSTLGRAIAQATHLPLLDKDDILEALFESRGIGSAKWRRQLSCIADQELIERAGKLPAAIIASWWHHPCSLADSGTPTEWLHSLHCEVVELHCVCNPGVAASRFVGRTRHPGHLDGRYTINSLLESFQTEAGFGPLKVGRIVEVRTEDHPNAEGLHGQLGFYPSIGEVCKALQAAGALSYAGVPRPADSSLTPLR